MRCRNCKGEMRDHLGAFKCPYMDGFFQAVHTNHSTFTIEAALREASDQQFASEVARRSQAKRKTKTGGRNGGRPKLI